MEKRLSLSYASRVVIMLRILLSSFCLTTVVSLYAQSPRLVIPVGHTLGITRVEFNPSGKRILTSANDKSSKLWDAVTGSLLVDLNEQNGVKNCEATFSPDGKIFASASTTGQIYIWNANSGTVMKELPGHLGYVYDLNFSTDNRKLLSAGDDRSVRLWDVTSGKAVVVINSAHERYTSSAIYSPLSRRIVTASSSDNVARIWDAESGELITELSGHTGGIKSIVLSPDEQTIATLSSDYGVKFWDIFSGVMIASINRTVYNYVTSVNFSPDSKKAVISSTDFKATVWDLTNGTLAVELTGHRSYVNYAVFSPDGKRIATGCLDNTARLWDAATGRLISSLEGHNASQFSRNVGSVTFITFSPDGKRVATVSMDDVKLWDGISGKFFKDLVVTERLSDLSFDHTGKRMLTSSSQVKTARLWNLENGKMIANLHNLSSGTESAAFSPDNSILITSGEDNVARIWNTIDGRMRDTIETIAVEKAVISNDGSKILLFGSSRLELWDAVRPVFLKEYSGHTPGKTVTDAMFTLDDKKIISVSTDSTCRIWDASSGKPIAELRGHKSFIHHCILSANNKLLVTTGSDNWLMGWDVENGERRFAIPYSSGFRQLAFTPDNRKIVAATYNNEITVLDAGTGKLLSRLESEEPWIDDTYFLSISSRGDLLVTVDRSGARLWDLKTNRQVRFFKLPPAASLAYVSFEDKRMVYVQNSRIIIISLETGKEIFSLLPVGTEDYISFLPSGYYLCTPAAAKKLNYVTSDLEVISFEQLDVRFNRPDKVLEAIGSPDVEAIRGFRKAWEKRVKKLGIDTSQFKSGYAMPILEIVNSDSIEYEQKRPTLQLRFKGKDAKYNLDRFNVWVNETPMFGKRGIPIRGAQRRNIDTTIIITLSQGENRIEASVTNASGVESYRMPLFVNHTPDIPGKEMTRFIGIGIDKFREDGHNLEYSTKDIRDLAKKLKERYKDSITIDTLFNENVTIGNVRRLREKLLTSSVNDRVILSYSGHGLLSRDYDYFLSTYDVNFANPEIGGLPYEDLEDLLDSIPARKKLMLIDACHSGEVDKDDGVAMNTTADSIGLSRGIIKKEKSKSPGGVGLQNSFDLMRAIFVNVGRSTGATVISAAAGNQYALERGDLKNGVFTYSLIEALEKNPALRISELRRIVGDRVEELTQGLQKPTSRNEAVAIDWEL